MQITSIKVKILMILLSGFIFCSCENSEFKSASPQSPEKGRNDAEEPEGNKKVNSQDKASPNAVKDRDEKKLSDLDEDDSCLKNGIEKINMVVALDNSGSQKKSDPTKVRASASKDFSRKLFEFRSKSSAVEINVALISFDGNSTSYTWITLNDESDLNNFLQDIDQATATTGSGTKYLPPLGDASQLLSQLTSSGSDEAERNYLAFLTDGRPNEDDSEIVSMVQQLVSSYDLAVFAVASGTGIKSSGEAVVRKMALPTINQKHKNHIGRYFRAQNASDLNSAWDNILDSVVSCEK